MNIEIILFAQRNIFQKYIHFIKEQHQQQIFLYCVPRQVNKVIILGTHHLP